MTEIHDSILCFIGRKKTHQKAMATVHRFMSGKSRPSWESWWDSSPCKVAAANYDLTFWKNTKRLL